MTTRAALTLSMSALLMGGTMVGCAAQHVGLAGKAGAADVRADDLAKAAAAKARVAVAAHNGPVAVAAAEEAVRWRPENAEYRVLLGQSYLAAGRFVSARDALTDALTLSPDNGRVALNLALAQTAMGDWAGARKTLDAHVDTIPAVDRGLAIALAGDPGTAVEILTEAARAPGADAKTRQNLALSLALAGHWAESKAVAALDLGADQIDKRMEEWAAFAYPKSASDQVASLLGVKPVADHGQPVALALSAAVPNKAMADTAQTDAPVEVAATAPAPEPAPVMVAAAEPETSVTSAPAQVAVTAPTPVANARPSVVFAERREVAQPGAGSAQPSAKPAARVAMVAAPAEAKGNFFVQLGAYKSAAFARDGWARVSQRYAGFAGHTPKGMPVKAHGVSYYRLSLGGFARNTADALCHDYRVQGGACFVRVGQGDRVAQWVQKGRPQLAAKPQAPQQLAMR
jgi:Flp pilus assembly protein TadD